MGPPRTTHDDARTLEGAEALEAIGLVEADGRLVVRDHVQVRGAALRGIDRVQRPVGKNIDTQVGMHA